MTDAELIARLNRWIEQQVLVLVDSDLLPIRDRIEALTEQLAAAQQDAKEAEAYAEELEADRKKTYEALLKVSRIHGEVEAKLATCEKYRDAYAEMDRIGTQAVRDLEAELALMMFERDEAWKRAAHSEKMWGEAEVKLAECEARLRKAVDAGQTMDDGCDCERCSKARATLAEIKGESHE
jgi:chromosome segregation ATPase